MKRFMLLHIGFEKPTPEIMSGWKKWFEETAPVTDQNAGLRSGREITRGGSVELAMGPNAITGYTIIRATSLDEAEGIARSNPFISSIRVYELAEH